jgi:hypothetical protein
VEQKGYVKLHRKILDNDLLYRDLSAYVVFTRLMLVVNRNTGTYVTGRFRLAELTMLKPTTAYSALKRLQKAKIISLVSDNKMTTISICNWHDYQSSDDNKMTTNRQQNDTEQELKSKKNSISTDVDILTPEQAQMEQDVDEMWTYWEDITGVPITRSKPSNRIACRTLLKAHGKDGLQQLIRAAGVASTEKYAPSIANFIQLRDKKGNLIIWAKKQGMNKDRKVVKI